MSLLRWLGQKGSVPGEDYPQYNWSECLLLVMALVLFPGSLIMLAYAFLLGWIK